MDVLGVVPDLFINRIEAVVLVSARPIRPVFRLSACLILGSIARVANPVLAAGLFALGLVELNPV